MAGRRRFGTGAEPDQRDVAHWRASVWRGSGETDLPPSLQGIVVLGTPLGDPAFIHAQLDACRAAGRRVTTNVTVRDLDLPVPNSTGCRGRIAVVRWFAGCSGHDIGVLDSRRWLLCKRRS